MKLLINGGCGFLGSNLASHAIEKGYDVTVFDNMSRLGSDRNREWLSTLGEYIFIHGDTETRMMLKISLKKENLTRYFILQAR